MPELPEVETVKRVLEKSIIKKKIADIDIIYSKIIKNIEIEDFKKELIGQEIKSMNRIGKYLIIEFKEKNLIFHFRMEGKLFYNTSNNELTKHDHLRISFSDGTNLVYNDTRKFGTIDIVYQKDMKNFFPITKLGIEANSEKLTVKYLKEKFAKYKKPIKQTLLDQTVINGLGNIYVDEILFASKINPLNPTNEIKEKEIKRIITNSKLIINEAILNGGSTIKSFAISENNHGNFQQKLKVYGKKGKECSVCKTEIQKIKIAGRGTHFCPHCQKENK